MKLPRLAIDNHQFTLVIFLLLVIMGISSFLTMPRTEDPPVQIPGASIFIIYPGANPNDLEKLIVQPVEEALNELEEIKKIQSTAMNGMVSVAVEFTFKTDAGEKYEEVVDAINGIRSDLPAEIYKLEISEWSSTDVSIFQFALISEIASLERMESLADNLKKDIERVNGVRSVEIHAMPRKQIRVETNVAKMAMMNISLDQVEKAIVSNNQNIPGGSLNISDRHFNVNSSGAYNDLDEIKETVVGSYEGRLIYLRDIASVQYNLEDNNYLARFNAKRCIFITVKQKENVNIFDIAGEIKQIADNFHQTLDEDMELAVVFDQSSSVDERINGFLGNLLQGIVLVGILIFLSLGVRAAVLVIIAIPFSILIGLGGVDIAGFGLQQISIAALVIALGLLVDNSIVVVENIERFIAMGYSRKEAAVKGVSQLGWPVVSATLTTLLAFIPIIMMPDKAGKFIQSLPVTVIFTLLASLFIALALSPYLATLFLKKYQKNNDGRFKRWLKSLITGPYHRTLVFAIERPVFVFLIALLALAGAFLLFMEVGVSFFPKAEKPQFMIRVNTPESANIHKTDKVARYVESVLDTIPLVEHFATNVGHGNPRIYYNIFPRQYARNFAEIFVELKYYEVDEFDRLINHLRELFAGYPGARIYIKELEQGNPIEAPLTIKINGDQMTTLRDITADVEQFVLKTPGTVNVDNQLDRVGTDIYFSINKNKAGIYGVPVYEIDKTIRTCVAGLTIAKFRDDKGEEYDIVLRMPGGEDFKLEDFDKIHVKSLSEKFIPLRQLAGYQFRETPGIITHFAMQRAGTVTADIQKGYTLDELIAELQSKLVDYNWPDGYSFEFTGELENRQESFGGMREAAIIAFIAILAVLILQFRSFVQPLIIFTSMPLAIIGSVLALYVTGNTFSFTAFIGFISLIGIVVNNSIILVDYTNELKRNGMKVKEAVIEAGETRFTPIILTTLTTIGGLLPLTLGGGTLWAPMGWTIIGGLLVSTFLTLVLVPVLYKAVTKDNTSNETETN